MPDQLGTTERLAIEVARALLPLGERLAPANVIETFETLGTGFAPNLLGLSGLNAKLLAASGAASGLTDLIAQVEQATDAPFPAALAELLTGIEGAIALVDGVGAIISNAVAQAPQALAPVSATVASTFGDALARTMVEDSLIR